MSEGVHGDEHMEILDWLHERGVQHDRERPGFDVERTISRARAVRDAGAVNFWNVLSPTERSAFERAARGRAFRPGTALMREGEQAGEVIVILVGWVKVCLDEDGRERVITERGPGDLVGEGGTAPGNVRSASVIALEAVQALVMETTGYTAFVAEYPGVPDLVKKQTYDRATGRVDRP
jgi:CRP-like cAMP-binding protein